jgi:hypothetical protein
MAMPRLPRLSLAALVLASLACSAVLPPRPKVEWDHSPDFLVAVAQTGGGMMYDPNPMPEARLWGDGRLVWVDQDQNGARQVFVAQLSGDEMRALLQLFVNAGFFGWKDTYSPGQVMDAPSSCLWVELQSADKSVCEVFSGAPAKFHDLYAALASGAGKPGTDFVPTRAYLQVAPFPADANTNVAEWNAAALGLSLTSVGEGQWVEGPALERAWEIVNAHHQNPVARDGQDRYTLILLVPGLTTLEPPSQQ